MLFITIPAPADGVWIRANQIGYLPNDPKIAVLSSDAPLAGNSWSGSSRRTSARTRAWGPFACTTTGWTFPIPGDRRIQSSCYSVESLPFRIGDDAYSDVPAKLLEFMQLQRCGFNPVTKELCHQEDAIDTITNARVDLRGGWHDAGDRLKHMITSLLRRALYSRPRKTRRISADLMRRINLAPDTIYVQIGDDRDHLPPATLWHDDQSDYGHGLAGRARRGQDRAARGAQTQKRIVRPGEPGRGAPLPPPRSRVISIMPITYALAKANPGCAMSVPVRPVLLRREHLPSMTRMGGHRTFIATGDRAFLNEAVRFADEAGSSKWMGHGRHGHYEFFPYVNLAHYRLYPHADEATQKRLAWLLPRRA
ncbi:MAG: glycoside hydrolase family 9 protein [Phycisphaerales bacterium]